MKNFNNPIKPIWLFSRSWFIRYLSFSILLLCTAQILLAQQPEFVTGTVTDAQDGTPLPGVNVIIKGTLSGTITDLDGNYRIELDSDLETPVLQFSYIGYKNIEIPVEGQSAINVAMELDLQRLEEVVVIGYGETSKRLLTSSISTVNAEEISTSISNGIEEAIQGKTSGIQIIQNSGTPGAALTVNIRGKSSISAGTKPLYVVDGIPITTGNFGQLGYEGQEIDASLDLNPNNIESISILKDASASAIYGARAANGVILITTKSGSRNETNFSFEASTGWQQIWRKLDMLDAEGWREYVSTFDSAFVAGLDPSVETDWQDEVLRVAPVTNIQMAVSGGQDKVRYYVSGRYFDQDGIVLGTSYQKFNNQTNLDFDATDRLEISMRIATNYSLNDRVRGDQTINGVLPNAISKPPVYAVRDSLGNYLEEGFWDNPVAIGNEAVNQARAFRNISSFSWDYKITDHLEFSNQWGLDFYHLDEIRYLPTTVKQGALNNGTGTSAKSELLKLTQNSTLKYQNVFREKHNLNVLAGYSFEIFRDRFNSISGNNFPSDELEYLESAGNITSGSSGANDSGLESFFGRAIYNYDNKYIFSFSIRHDGSPNFGENKRYATLPAASLAWRISEESFMETFPQVSELKFKLSYGWTGNDKIGSFRSRNLYASGYNYYGNPGIVPSQIPNPDLKWETTASMDVGVDLGLFNDRIYLTADYYHNKTTDLLLNRPIPGTTGFSSVAANVGELENKGFEFLLSSVNFNGTFNWTTDLNLSINRNKVLKLYEDQPITDVGRGNNAVIVDQPIGVFFMYQSLGVDPSTGDLVFEDLNGDGEYTDEDRKVVGDPNPDFIGGLTNKFSYAGFDFSVFLQFSYGNDIFNGTRQYAESMKFSTSDNQLATIQDRWREPGDETYVPRHNGTYNLFPLSSHYIEDGSYLRIKDITLGYSLPANLLDETRFFTRLRVYAKVQNLFTLTPYSGMDPEAHYSGPDNIRSGTDFFTFPQPRSLSFGISAGF